MKIKLLLLVCSLLLFACGKNQKQPAAGNNLVFNELANVWDEAIPLGNGMVGNLVWQKNGKLRFSLDRADLWDLRPMENIDFEKWKFQDVYEYWKADKYEEVQKAFDIPYNKLPAPSKIPAGALEFNIEKLGQVKRVRLEIETAICTVEWENGATLSTFVHAEKPIGWYKFENLPQSIKIELVSPAYNRENTQGYTAQAKNDLNQLGYEQGDISREKNALTYNQKGWRNFRYQIHTAWEESANELTGCWSVSSANKNWKTSLSAIECVQSEFETGYDSAIKTHLNWWNNYWSKSKVHIPDSLLQRQYMLEMYKFGSAARADAPPIALQSVWTADHGKLPPWKGDFHHDLNTQLSYWPSYAGNQMQLEEGFINWLWKYRSTFRKYTHDYFNVEGLNVPGVTTLEGEPMGGWIQYSFGQTVSAWLSHHFYLHWQFTKDRDFLEQKAYPWLKEVSEFLKNVSVMENGKRKLKISSSPEIFNNSRQAWFKETTNFDLALIKWNVGKTIELCNELGFAGEADYWSQFLSEWPDLAVDDETGFMFAPEFPYHESHRHFSHLMAFHPLGLVDFSNGEADRKIIQNTLKNLNKKGSDYWTGYSFSWQANLYARAFEGEKAAEALRIFAKCFCLPNSFHVNGDQCKAGHSKMTYRPFTLEGNFAFASAIQEMLIQSHTGVVKVFPAIPKGWKDCDFEHLRTYGAFLVSAEMKNGSVECVRIYAEKGGTFVLQNPFANNEFKSNKAYEMVGQNLVFKLVEGESLKLSLL